MVEWRCEGEMASIGPSVTMSSKCEGCRPMHQAEGMGCQRCEPDLIYRLGDLYCSPYC